MLKALNASVIASSSLAVNWPVGGTAEVAEVMVAMMSVKPVMMV